MRSILVRTALPLLVLLAACSGDGTGPGGDVGGGNGNGGGSLPAELAGTWNTGSVSMIQYYNPYDGSWAPTSGQGYTYTFTPDGKYTYAGLLQISTYGCTTTLFLYVEGTAKADGETLVLQPKKGSFESKDTCVAKNNYKKGIDKTQERYGYTIGVNAYGRTELVLTWPSGETSSFELEE